jgi:hypothetical protein
MRRARAAVIAMVLAAVLGGCGNSTSLPMTQDAAAQLAGASADVRTAIERGDRTAADQALADLRSLVASLQRKREINSAKASAILDAIVSVQQELILVPTTTTTTIQDKGKGNKGNGSGKGD